MNAEDDNLTKDTPSYCLPLHVQNSTTGRITRNIASFLSLQDAASAAGVSPSFPTDSWLFRGEPDALEPPRWSEAAPGLIALSPNALNQAFDYDDGEEDRMDEVDTDIQQEQRRAWAQEQLASAIFSHPQPLRKFCADAFLTAKHVSLNQRQFQDSSPETCIEPTRVQKKNKRRRKQEQILSLVDHILKNVPVSVLLDVLESLSELSLDTSFSMLRISGNTINGIVNAVVGSLVTVGDTIVHFNPISLIHIIVSRPFNAMGKTTEVVVSGIQSVATGVGSASSMAFRNLSAKATPASNFGRQGTLRRSRSSPGKSMNEKLLKKLCTINSAASVISYTESADDTGALSRLAKSRVQRMMHYEINLRPFVATVKVSGLESLGEMKTSNIKSGENDDTSAASPGSPFMCTPQSFPPTPASRRRVLARGTRFADDVIFLARDQLRVHDALDSKNERTREMALALNQGRTLAVFDADDASAGIDLTCGQHVATKVGNMLYCSTRSMVPILRNCYVYFEMTVLPRPGESLIPQASMATLSIGLSTKEMPPNTLVGAWQGSVGLCTTGQILTGGQWCSPVDPSSSSYGDRATVGCLVCLDDGSAFETWDGVMVTAAVTFNVNGTIVSPPVSTQPIADVGLSTSEPQHPTPQASIQPLVPPSFTLPLLVPAEEELYPTVTLHSPGVAVMSRFSTGDVLATSRKDIGAPAGVTVYCVDGSLFSAIAPPP
jgi:hypothetical protein